MPQIMINFDLELLEPFKNFNKEYCKNDELCTSNPRYQVFKRH